MIVNKGLDYYKSQKISDAKIEDLKDITSIRIDTKKPVVERILSYMEQIGNPYLFKVGDIPVKVSFNDKGLTLQRSLELFFTKNP